MSEKDDEIYGFENNKAPYDKCDDMNRESFEKFLDSLKAKGGADTPEDINGAL